MAQRPSQWAMGCWENLGELVSFLCHPSATLPVRAGFAVGIIQVSIKCIGHKECKTLFCFSNYLVIESEGKLNGAVS